MEEKEKNCMFVIRKVKNTIRPFLWQSNVIIEIFNSSAFSLISASSPSAPFSIESSSGSVLFNLLGIEQTANMPRTKPVIDKR